MGFIYHDKNIVTVKKNITKFRTISNSFVFLFSSLNVILNHQEIIFKYENTFLNS